MPSRKFDPKAAIEKELKDTSAAESVGMLTIKTANRAVNDSITRPDPKELFMEFWYEGEVSCLFSDSNLGKSIFAVQIAEHIARMQPVLYVDCELSEKQFQLRYTDTETQHRHIFPPKLFRAEIDPMRMDMNNYEENILRDIEATMLFLHCRCAIIDNLGYLCNSTDKGVDAGAFMIRLTQLKKKHEWSILVMAHTPKRSLASHLEQNDLAGSKRLFNYFDSVFAIGRSCKDRKLRYVKQLKVRAGAFRYDADNVLIYEIVKTEGFTHLELKGYSTEAEHLKELTERDNKALREQIAALRTRGYSIRAMEGMLGISKSAIGRIVRKLEDEKLVPSRDDLGQADDLGQDNYVGDEDDD